MDSILVVFYSYTGVSRRAAQLIAAHYDWPMGEIRDARLRAGFLGGLRCLLDSLFRRRPAIRYEGPDPAGFRTVILISPIWAYRMAGPMRSFLAERGGTHPPLCAGDADERGGLVASSGRGAAIDRAPRSSYRRVPLPRVRGWDWHRASAQVRRDADARIHLIRSLGLGQDRWRGTRLSILCVQFRREMQRGRFAGREAEPARSPQTQVLWQPRTPPLASSRRGGRCRHRWSV